MSSSESDKKPASDFRQSPIIDFFTAEDTSTNDDPRGRKRTVPMKVMCLGLSRSGTESLAKALEMLGQRFNVVSNSNHARLWYEALCSKFYNRGKVWTREDYDQLIGDFHATTDVPCSFFAMDLIRAYPEAKVILNKREFNAWHKSVVINLDQILKSWFFAIFMRLERGLLDIYRIFFNLYNIHFAGDLARNGRVTYEEHCALVRGAMADRKEEFLEWQVTDGWEPLCKFLELPVPKEPFPSGNATAEFDKRIQSSTVKRFRKALRNLVILVVLAIAGVMWAFGVIYPPAWVDRASGKQ